MHFMPVAMDVRLDEIPENHYIVVHPLNDLPEEKIDTSNLGPMPMTTSVKLSLLSLRAYLLLMIGLVLYQCSTWLDCSDTTANSRKESMNPREPHRNSPRGLD